VFALFGVGMTLSTKNGIFDVIGTAMIGLLLVAVAVTLAIETKSLLLGESASREAIGKIEAALAGTPGVDRVIHLKTMHMGPEEVLVAAKIGVIGSTTVAELTEVIDRAEANIRSAEPMVTSLYLEPDLYRSDYEPAPRPERPGAPSH
jgi:divalent metal cation (Fe/Co/Zn/Cd) transporter